MQKPTDFDQYALSFAESHADDVEQSFIEGANAQIANMDRDIQAQARADIKKAATMQRRVHFDTALVAFRAGVKLACDVLQGNGGVMPALSGMSGRMPQFALGQVVERRYSKESQETPVLGQVMAVYDCLDAAIVAGAVDEDWYSYQLDPSSDVDELYYQLHGYGAILAAESQLIAVPQAVEVAVIEKLSRIDSGEDEAIALGVELFKREYKEAEAIRVMKKAQKRIAIATAQEDEQKEKDKGEVQ